MEEWSSFSLFSLLILLIVISGFFSGSETGMMSINRYRLRHLARKNHSLATMTLKLLRRPDRILGVILIGNTFANLFASVIMTIIAMRLFGNLGLALATVILTLIILIFAEITPKTLAALYPERVSFIVAIPLKILLTVCYPLVWLANGIANGLLRCFNVKLTKSLTEHLTGDELRTVVRESGGLLPSKGKGMLLNVLDLETVTVEDIMVPRNEIVGIDLSDTWSSILERLRTSQHTRLPVYQENIEKMLGMIHMRDVLNLLADDKLTKNTLKKALQPIYYVPEASTLSNLLVNFQQAKTRSGMVVDEYGDILGLVTLEDILEEIVGDFTTNIAETTEEIRPQADGSFLIEGSANIRDINRTMDWHLSTEGPKTLSGLIIEYLEFIPPIGTTIKWDEYVIEVMRVKDNRVALAKVRLYP